MVVTVYRLVRNSEMANSEVTVFEVLKRHMIRELLAT